jgi:hypothetical protein
MFLFETQLEQGHSCPEGVSQSIGPRDLHTGLVEEGDEVMNEGKGKG